MMEKQKHINHRWQDMFLILHTIPDTPISSIVARGETLQRATGTLSKPAVHAENTSSNLESGDNSTNFSLSRRADKFTEEYYTSYSRCRIKNTSIIN